MYDIIVIGAGPAGLAFLASEAMQSKSIALVEMGKDLDERDSVPTEIATGVGGAGAYVDGKFSFYPAGKALYDLDYLILSKAYAEFAKHLQAFTDQEIPALPSRERIAKYQFKTSKKWQLKAYESIYLSIEERFDYLRWLDQRKCLLIRQKVIAIEPIPLGYKVGLSNGDYLDCKQVVLAGGRFQPLQNLVFQRFRRYEFGVRIEVSHDNHAITDMGDCSVLDPKLIYQLDEKIQYRTFCFCRRGMVCETDVDGIQSWSGRADVEPTRRTNFGLMVRTTFPITDQDWNQFLSRKFIFQNYHNLITFGTIGNLVYRAICQIFQTLPSLDCADLKIYGPCVEGVGDYPDIDDALQVKGQPGIYTIGDATGTFRGLVPALVSGYYLAYKLE